MDLYHSVTSPYQVLRNEGNHPESPAVEQPSSSAQITPPPMGPESPAPSPPTPGLAFPEWSPSPPPYAEAEATLGTEGRGEPGSGPGPGPGLGLRSGLGPGPGLGLGPPPYSVATSLPTYDEAERAKAAALAASAAAPGQPPHREDDFHPRGDAADTLDPDQLRLGNDGIFMVAFFMAFIFNWLGFCLAICTNCIAGRYGALCGLGLSVTKWVLIVRFSDYFTGYFHGQYWFLWLFLLMGLLLFFRGFYSYLKVRNMSERLAPGDRTRYIFSN